MASAAPTTSRRCRRPGVVRCAAHLSAHLSSSAANRWPRYRPTPQTPTRTASDGRVSRSQQQQLSDLLVQVV